jgi:hypothetical protein
LYSIRPTVTPEMFAGLRPQVVTLDATSLAKERAEMSTVLRVSTSARSRKIGYRPDGTPAALQLNELVLTGTAAAQGAIDIVTSVESMAESREVG